MFTGEHSLYSQENTVYVHRRTQSMFTEEHSLCSQENTVYVHRRTQSMFTEEHSLFSQKNTVYVCRAADVHVGEEVLAESADVCTRRASTTLQCGLGMSWTAVDSGRLNSCQLYFTAAQSVAEGGQAASSTTCLLGEERESRPSVQVLQIALDLQM